MARPTHPLLPRAPEKAKVGVAQAGGLASPGTMGPWAGAFDHMLQWSKPGPLSVRKIALQTQMGKLRRGTPIALGRV